MLVAKLFRDALLGLLSLSERAGSGLFVVAAMIFVVMLVVVFPWLKSSGGQFRFSIGPSCLPTIFSISTRSW